MTIETLDELIESLKELRRTLSSKKQAETVQVRIAYQPSHPLAANLSEVTLQVASTDEGREGLVLWLAASDTVKYGEHPYAAPDAWKGGLVYGVGED